MLRKEEKSLLLDLARRSIEYYLDNRQKLEPNLADVPYDLCDNKGVFVTLGKKNGELRGCMGYLEPIKPVWEAVIENAVNAAFYDTRFRKLTKSELDDITIEISILGDIKKLYYTNSDDLLQKIEKGMGVILKKGMASATFLPEVWKQISNKKEFLEQLCLKAGLRPDVWIADKLEISYYTAETISELHNK